MRCPPVGVPTCLRRCRPPRSYRNAASAAFFIGAVVVIFCAPGHYRFRLYAELLSLCLRERESNQRESAPGIRVSLRETSLVPALFRGSSRWAIPAPSCLVWHPCQTPLSTAPPLGLLTGPGDRGAYMIGGSGLDREAFAAQAWDAAHGSNVIRCGVLW